MTKVKKHTLASIIVLLFTCAILALTAGAIIPARAAESFNADTEGGFVCPGGASETTILAAINTKIDEINTAIEAVNANENKTLAEAYADGTVLVYSNDNDGIITKDGNRRSGWKVWEQLAIMDLKNLNAGSTEWGENHMTAVSYNGEDGKAYLVAPVFADQYYRTNTKKLGSAICDPFVIEGVTYQNFSGGYLKLENGNVAEVAGKNINKTTGAEENANAKPMLGAATPNFEGVDNAKLYNAFVTAYDGYVAKEYNPGYPFTVVRKEGDLIVQHLRNGDSTANPYGDGSRNHWAHLVYNKDMEQAFLMVDEFAKGDGSGDAIKNIGAPVSDMFTIEGVKYQNFEKGYGKVENGSLSIENGKNVNEDTGLEETLDEVGKIGKLSKAVTDNLPTGVTAAELSQAFKTAYTDKVEYSEGETLQSVDLVTYENNLLLQTYTDNNGKKHKLVYTANGFIYLRPAVADKYAASLGAPVGERIKVAEAEEKAIYAYPFENGYIRLTVTEDFEIVDGQAITKINEYAVMTAGATFDKEKVFFETTSYAENFKASIVNHTDGGSGSRPLERAPWTTWGLTMPSDEELAAAFKTAYEEAFAIGFSAGKPVDAGIVAWESGNSYVIKITLQGGNGNANFWGDNTLMTYDPFAKKVYITTGNIADTYANDGASGNGWATTEMLINTETGVIVQQYYVKDIVTERYSYIIETNGSANKVEGAQYDFDANKKGGEWVPYLAQFGGSISAKPVQVEQVAKGQPVEIDFAKFVNNEDGYTVKWNLVGNQGSLSDSGVYTLAAMPATDLTVTVEVYSAFDKLTLTATIKGEQGGTPDDGNKDNNTENGKKKGCKSDLAASSVAGAAVVLFALGGVMLFTKKRTKKEN